MKFNGFWIDEIPSAGYFIHQNDYTRSISFPFVVKGNVGNQSITDDTLH